MADEYKDVRRVTTNSRTELQNTLKTKMIGLSNDTTNPVLGMKTDAGNMVYFPAEGTDATFRNTTISSLATGYVQGVGVDANGKLIIKNTTTPTDLIPFIVRNETELIQALANTEYTAKTIILENDGTTGNGVGLSINSLDLKVYGQNFIYGLMEFHFRGEPNPNTGFNEINISKVNPSVETRIYIYTHLTIFSNSPSVNINGVWIYCKELFDEPSNLTVTNCNLNYEKGDDPIGSGLTKWYWDNTFDVQTEHDYNALKIQQFAGCNGSTFMPDDEESVFPVKHYDSTFDWTDKCISVLPIKNFQSSSLPQAWHNKCKVTVNVGKSVETAIIDNNRGDVRVIYEQRPWDNDSNTPLSWHIETGNTSTNPLLIDAFVVFDTIPSAQDVYIKLENSSWGSAAMLLEPPVDLSSVQNRVAYPRDTNLIATVGDITSSITTSDNKIQMSNGTGGIEDTGLSVSYNPGVNQNIVTDGNLNIFGGSTNNKSVHISGSEVKLGVNANSESSITIDKTVKQVRNYTEDFIVENYNNDDMLRVRPASLDVTNVGEVNVNTTDNQDFRIDNAGLTYISNDGYKSAYIRSKYLELKGYVNGGHGLILNDYFWDQYNCTAIKSKAGAYSKIFALSSDGAIFYGANDAGTTNPGNCKHKWYNSSDNLSNPAQNNMTLHGMFVDTGDGANTLELPVTSIQNIDDGSDRTVVTKEWVNAKIPGMSFYVTTQDEFLAALENPDYEEKTIILAEGNDLNGRAHIPMPYAEVYGTCYIYGGQVLAINGLSKSPLYTAYPEAIVFIHTPIVSPNLSTISLNGVTLWTRTFRTNSNTTINGGYLGYERLDTTAGTISGTTQVNKYAWDNSVVPGTYEGITSNSTTTFNILKSDAGTQKTYTGSLPTLDIYFPTDFTEKGWVDFVMTSKTNKQAINIYSNNVLITSVANIKGDFRITKTGASTFNVMYGTFNTNYTSVATSTSNSLTVSPLNENSFQWFNSTSSTFTVNFNSATTINAWIDVAFADKSLTRTIVIQENGLTVSTVQNVLGDIRIAKKGINDYYWTCNYATTTQQYYINFPLLTADANRGINFNAQTGYMCKAFANQGGTFTKVALYTSTGQSSLTVYIYKGSISANSCVKLATATVNLNTIGFNIATLDTPVTLTAGEPFYVVVYARSSQAGNGSYLASITASTVISSAQTNDSRLIWDVTSTSDILPSPITLSNLSAPQPNSKIPYFVCMAN